MIKRELQPFWLLPFTKAKYAVGLIDFSEGKRETLEAQAFQLVLATCSKTVAHIIDNADSTFKAIQHLFGGYL